MSQLNKQFEIFSGTGGVGKTTLATSRAIELARSGNRVLLITIDPAKRLKDLLKLEGEGEVIQVTDPLSEGENLELFVELMNPEKTFARMAKESNAEEVLQNRIVSILTRPYGGLNEILSIVELNMNYLSGKYDTIVLDTPPGSHFLDFLDATQRIQVFFDKSFVDIFNYLGKKTDLTGVNIGKKIFNKVISSGIKKLLSYLSKVTGDQFVDEFIEAVLAIYKTKSSFLAALQLQQTLKDDKYSNWFLVTSVEQNKLEEALQLKAHAKGLITNKSYMVLNKCIENELMKWSPSADHKNYKLKETLLNRERHLKKSLKDSFEKVLEFPEVISLSPLDHLKGLTQTWKNC